MSRRDVDPSEIRGLKDGGQRYDGTVLASSYDAAQAALQPVGARSIVEPGSLSTFRMALARPSLRVAHILFGMLVSEELAQTPQKIVRTTCSYYT